MQDARRRELEQEIGLALNAPVLEQVVRLERVGLVERDIGVGELRQLGPHLEEARQVRGRDSQRRARRKQIVDQRPW